MGGTIDALNTLKQDLEVLKNSCNDSILLLDGDDKWSNVKKAIDGLIEEIDTAIGDYPSSFGSKMEKIENSLPE